jgi:hypothetical protein
MCTRPEAKTRVESLTKRTLAGRKLSKHSTKHELQEVQAGQAGGAGKAVASGGGGRNKGATSGKDVNAYSFSPAEGEANRKILLSPNHHFFVCSDPYEEDRLP